MGNSILLIVIAILLIYIYAKRIKIHQLKSESNKDKSLQKPPEYKIPPPKCPDPTENHVAKCWANPKTNEYSCRHVDENGVIQDVDPTCCYPTCDQIQKVADAYEKKPEPPKITGKRYFCFNKYQEKCYAKELDLNKQSNNYCDVNTTSNITSPMYETEDKCYKANLFYKNLTRKQCLKHNYYGWCTDSEGNGQCLPGTSEGPNWASKYNCQADITGPYNSWTLGQSSPYITVPNGHWKA